MKKLKYLMLLLVFSFMIVGCNKQQEVKPKSTSTPLLLEVTKEGVKNKLYLFGSIHVAEESMYPLPDYVMNAYKKSNVIAVEFDLVEYTKDLSSQMELLSKFVLVDGTKVNDYIEEEDYNKAVEILKNAGLYSSVFDVYNPMFWVSLIESATIVDANLDEKYGIDNYFLNLSKEDGKEIMELESAEYQYNMLLSFDYDTQVYLLKQGIHDYNDSRDAMKKLYELYKKGNKAELEKSVFETEDESDPYIKEYNNKLITVRNKNMAESLEEVFEEGKDIFCTVGLAHIIGEGGIADLLEQQGYTVKIVK